MRLLNTIIHPNLRRFRLTMSGYFSETYHLLTSASISFEYEPSEESNLLAPEPKVHKVLELRTGISCEQGASEHRATSVLLSMRNCVELNKRCSQ